MGAGERDGCVGLVFGDEEERAVGLAVEPLDGDAVVEAGGDHFLVEGERVGLRVVDGNDGAVVEDGRHRIAVNADAGEVVGVWAPSVLNQSVAFDIGLGDFARGAGGGGIAKQRDRDVGVETFEGAEAVGPVGGGNDLQAGRG